MRLLLSIFVMLFALVLTAPWQVNANPWPTWYLVYLDESEEFDFEVVEEWLDSEENPIIFNWTGNWVSWDDENMPATWVTTELDQGQTYTYYVYLDDPSQEEDVPDIYEVTSTDGYVGIEWRYNPPASEVVVTLHVGCNEAE